MPFDRYLKAITAAVVAGLGSAYTAVTASPTHSIDLASGIGIAIATLTALGGVYATSNSTAAAAPAQHATGGELLPSPVLASTAVNATALLDLANSIHPEPSAPDPFMNGSGAATEASP
jgi:uncharacterized protein with beta-barrel porin domain